MGGPGRVRAQVDSGEAPTHRIHLWPDLVAAGTSRKDHRSLRHFSPSCHEAAAKEGRPGVFRTAEKREGMVSLRGRGDYKREGRAGRGRHTVLLQPEQSYFSLQVLLSRMGRACGRAETGFPVQSVQGADVGNGT